MNVSLSRWLWEGTFPVQPPRLLVPTLDESAGGGDLASLTRKVLTQLARLEDRLREARPTGEGSDREVRQITRNLLPTLDALDRIIEFATREVARKPELENWLASLT